MSIDRREPIGDIHELPPPGSLLEHLRRICLDRAAAARGCFRGQTKR